MQKFILGLLGSYGVYLAIIAGVSVAYLGWERHLIHKGEEKQKSRVEQAGRKVDAKAATARRAAEREPDKRLREYWRD